MKSGEMKHEMTLLHTMGPNRIFIVPGTPCFCDHIWSQVEHFSET